MKKIEELRDYIDTHDTSVEMEQGHWETEVAEDPMVTTSLRLPKSLLDWVRQQAAAEHVKPTAWLRGLIEQQRAGHADLEERVSALETVISSWLAHLRPASPARRTPGGPTAAGTRVAAQPIKIAGRHARATAGKDAKTGNPTPGTRRRTRSGSR
ncbi:hypothetical protein [Gandjariella thermophila]|uniref:Uncharacterized protein n=1 Tax=Gandjariella thermophila TaxID=1931992 RepID=A0A4D4JA37_9PSEU|nr:hypothetical protein [Gandjariella thermophila]GDY32434.1 hypothetical protein GTS_40670 [Gandjariella thermophila]